MKNTASSGQSPCVPVMHVAFIAAGKCCEFGNRRLNWRDKDVLLPTWSYVSGKNKLGSTSLSILYPILLHQDTDSVQLFIVWKRCWKPATWAHKCRRLAILVDVNWTTYCFVILKYSKGTLTGLGDGFMDAEGGCGHIRSIPEVSNTVTGLLIPCASFPNSLLSQEILRTSWCVSTSCFSTRKSHQSPATSKSDQFWMNILVQIWRWWFWLKTSFII